MAPWAALIALTVLAYAPAMRAGWIWDDDYYVTQNSNLRSVEGLRDLWFKLGAVPQYYPVTHTSFWLEYRCFGLNPAPYHFDNILLHASGAVLLWLLLRKLNVPGAWLAAAVWAVHPVNVESVAWVTERKNVLSGVLYLGAMLAYLRVDENRSGETSKPRWGFYALALLLFVCALLSKSVTASLPASILLILWWKRGRIRWSDVWPLAPMFVLGLAMSALTSHLERTVVGATGPSFDLSPVQRLLIAGRAVWFYAWKLVWPAKLTFIYPRWMVDWHIPWQWILPIAAAGLVITLFLLRRRIGRGPVVAALFFGGTLLPALGFINVLPMRYSFVADHFQYLASIGLIVLIVGAASHRLGTRTIGRAIAACLLIALTITTMVRQSAFMNLRALWQDTLVKNPDGPMPNNNYAMLLMADQKFDDADAHLRRAIAADRFNYEAVANLGALDELRGDVAGATEQYRRAISIEPKHAVAQTNLGKVLIATGQAAEGLEHLAAAVAANPRYVPAYRATAIAYEKQGDLPRAIAEIQHAAQLDPTDADVRVDLSRLLARQGDLLAANREAAEAVRLDPSNAAAHNQRGMLLEAQGDVAGATRAYRRALELRPNFPQAQRNLQRISGAGAGP